MDYKIESIKNYIETEEFLSLADQIYNLTKHLNNSYPNYKDWFYNKQLKESLSPNRNILFVRNKNNQVVGVASLKNTKEEKKLCTLYIKKEYRNQKITTELIKESFEYLETTRPLITFSENKLSMFENIINKYNWELIQIEENIYTNDNREYCYNGRLSK